MKHAATGALLGPLVPDPENRTPLYRRVYERIRELILDGTLARGARLPSTRTLASDLALSRNTVLQAVEQLVFEGYLTSRVGDGTYVAAALPEDRETVRWPQLDGEPRGRRGERRLSRRGERLRSMPVSPDPPEARAFAVGMPDLEAFPWKIWHRLWTRHLREPDRALLSYGDPAGHRSLREAIATYLTTARGVRCDADQVIVVSSSQQAIDLAARVVTDPGDRAWIEDPGYLGARGALLAAGNVLVPVPVDDQGLRVEDGDALFPRARLVYVTPSHQFPLGSVMSLERRLELLEWASERGAWILEDDYDSELRYVGQPLAALQGLDRSGGGRVIYIGTFTKVVFPSLRLAYMVPPRDLIEPILSARSFVDRHSPTLPQVVLAELITEGHFAAHIRRMRALYKERQEILLDALVRRLGGFLKTRPDPAGMHLVAELPAGENDREIHARCAEAGIDLSPLSRYFLGDGAKHGLVLGYAGVGEQAIEDGVELLESVLARDRPRSPPPA